MKVIVSDHVVLRYLERGKGYDIEGVRQHIARLTEAAVKVGARSLQIDGVAFQFRDGVVTTALEPRMKTYKKRVPR